MPTMQDVANKANVSLSTVSHALSGKRPISKETRDRIQQAIEELGYHPNELARRLANRESKILGLFFPRFHTGLSDMQFEFIQAAIDSAEAHGYAILLWRSPTSADEVIKLTQQGLVDGVILMEVRQKDERVDCLREMSFPFSMIGRTKDNSGISFVDLDNSLAIQDAFQYLVEQGHTQIAYINYPESMVHAHYGPAVYCYEGYQKALEKDKLKMITGCCEATPAAAYQLVSQLMRENPHLTSLVTPNEAGLPGMYQALQDAGKRIPADFSVIAIASQRRAERMIPSLTAMDFPTEDEGRMGVDILVETLQEKDVEPIQKLLRAKLVIRQSSGPAPK